MITAYSPRWTATPRPESSDPEIRLPRDVYYVLIHTLRATLPPPAVGTPEEIARRDNAAIAQVAAMLPPMPMRPTSPPCASAPAPMGWTACARPAR